jgi:hypothetical protein
VEPTPEKQCGTCKHWRKLPTDPANLNDIRGLCTHSPPSVTTVLGPRGQLQFSNYPQLPPDFFACGQHEAELPKLAMTG